METEDSYSFPLYHRIGQVARPILNSRYWIVGVIVVATLLYIPTLFAGFFQDDYGFRLNFTPEAYEKLGTTADIFQNGPLNLYAFSWDTEIRFSLGKERGIVPWWASDQIRTNFFRPLSSLTLALDYTLWPNTPFVMHLHSLLWFGLFILLAYRLYKTLSGSVAVAGVSILLLVADDVLSNPVGWISNRHALIAMTFAVLCVWLYHEGISRKKWALIAGAWGTYLVALLASEMGLITFAYLFAYAVVMDRDRWAARLGRFVPFILITIAWRLVYNGLGYGASGTLLYVDPILNPSDFITQLLIRYPILLFSAVGLPVVDPLLAFSPQAAAVLAMMCLILLVLWGLASYPVLKRHRTSAFWAVGLLLAVIPLVAGIPQSRNLGPVSIGLMGLAGQLLVDVATMKKPAPVSTFQVVLLKTTVPVLLMVHLAFAPLLVLLGPVISSSSSSAQAQVVDFGSDPAIEQQHMYIINPPSAMMYIAGLMQQVFNDRPIPERMNYLSSGFTPVQIERVDERTIVVTPEGGYTPLPGTIINPATGMATEVDLQNVYRALDENFYNPRNPMHVGQVVELSEVTIEVTEMTDDGRIAQAKFTFARPLEDERYVWLLWDDVSSTYERAQMPPVGETRVFDVEDLG